MNLQLKLRLEKEKGTFLCFKGNMSKMTEIQERLNESVYQLWGSHYDITNFFKNNLKKLLFCLTIAEKWIMQQFDGDKLVY